MPFVTRKSFLTLTVLAIAGGLIVGGFIWFGIYNIGADDAHTRPVYTLLRTIQQRSIASRASSIEVPDLSDPALIRQGAGNYDSMCTGCHLAPGMEDTELSKGLYPAPPAFAKTAVGNAAHHFWVIKHGIKASGMPAWGKSMEDQYIWGMVAFVQELPALDADEYQALVASSGGHSHGGGESEPHGHADGMSEDHHSDDHHSEDHHDMPDMDAGEIAGQAPDKAVAKEGVMHTHADGTREMHPAPAETPEPAEHDDDGHEH